MVDKDDELYAYCIIWQNPLDCVNCTKLIQILEKMIPTGTKEDWSVNCTWIILLNYDGPTETRSAKTGGRVNKGENQLDATNSGLLVINCSSTCFVCLYAWNMLRNNWLPINHYLLHLVGSHLYLLIKDARLFEHKVSLEEE